MSLQAVTTEAAVKQNTVICTRRFCLMDKLDSGKLQKQIWSMYIYIKTVNFTVTEVDLLSGNDKSAKQDNPLGVITVLSLTRFFLVKPDTWAPHVVAYQLICHSFPRIASNGV